MMISDSLAHSHASPRLWLQERWLKQASSMDRWGYVFHEWITEDGETRSVPFCVRGEQGWLPSRKQICNLLLSVLGHGLLRHCSGSSLSAGASKPCSGSSQSIEISGAHCATTAQTPRSSTSMAVALFFGRYFLTVFWICGGCGTLQ